MNREKMNKIYCPTIFGYGIVAIFLTQLNMLIHFQWAVPVFADVLSFLSAAALTGVACFDMTFKVQGANRKAIFVLKLVEEFCSNKFSNEMCKIRAGTDSDSDCYSL